MKRNLTAVAVALTLFALTTFAPQRAHAEDWEEIGLWSAAAFGDLLYIPAKAIVLLGCALGAGLSYAVTIPMDNTDLSEEIFGWGLYGDWSLRPEHVVFDEYPQIIGFDQEVRFLSELHRGLWIDERL